MMLLKVIIPLLTATLLAALGASSAQACDGTGRDGCTCIAYSSDYHVMGDEVIADYEMQVDAQDLQNSRNVALKTITAVLQQDRANFHKFNRPSPLDDYERFFATSTRRKLFQTLTLTSFCGADSTDPSILYDRIDVVSRNAMREGTLLHVMVYRIGNEFRVHIAPIG